MDEGSPQEKPWRTHQLRDERDTKWQFPAQEKGAKVLAQSGVASRHRMIADPVNTGPHRRRSQGDAGEAPCVCMFCNGATTTVGWSRDSRKWTPSTS